jgi:precorrin-3B methylase
MIWIIMKDEAHLIVGYNTHERHGEYELWITKATGKTQLIASGNEDEVTLVKNAIQYAIENGKKLLDLVSQTA